MPITRDSLASNSIVHNLARPSGERAIFARRDAILVSIAACAVPWAFVRAAPRARIDQRRYAQAVVIDSLGGPGGFHPDAPDDGPLDARAIADVRASGVAAINVTVNEVGKTTRHGVERIAVESSVSVGESRRTDRLGATLALGLMPAAVMADKERREATVRENRAA